MSRLPTRMRNRWLDRVDPGPEKGVLYWHVLMHADSQVRAAVMDAQKTLAGFPGLHMTPLKWLHMTTLVAGSTDEISRTQMAAMVSKTQLLLRGVDPIPVTLNKVFYHPEAIALLVRPTDALQPILNAAQAATLTTLGHAGELGEPSSSWMPHITISYSTADQPAEPIISALGLAIQERRVLVDSLALVIQWGPERSWNWEPVGTAQLGLP